MKTLTYIIIVLFLFLLIFIVTMPFKLISMLWYWEKMNEFTIGYREQKTGYIDTIINLTLTILHKID